MIAKETPIRLERYDALDGIRAYATIGIAMMHVLANGNYAVSGFAFQLLIPSFKNLVFLFMMLSAFSMCCGYYDRVINNEITIGQFYGRRYAKIWPFFTLLCAIDLILSPSINSLYEVFANLTLCFGLLPNAKISVIGVGWTLGVIFLFYLVFPFFCYLLSDKRRAWLSFAVALIFNRICIIYFFDENHVLENFSARTNFIYCAVFFLMGGLVFLYRKILKELSEKYHWICWLLCFVVAVGYYELGSTIIVMLLLFSLLLIYALARKRERVLSNPVTKYISGISMEVYLCHMVSFRAIEKMHMTHLFASDVLSYMAATVATISGAIIIATVSHLGIAKLEDMLMMVKRNERHKLRHFINHGRKA